MTKSPETQKEHGVEIGQELGHVDVSGTTSADSLVKLAAEVVSAYVSNNNHKVSPQEIPSILQEVHASLSQIKQKVSRLSPGLQKPAVEVEDSVHDDYIVCLEDGRKLKILKRYLRTHFGMSLEEYRTKWNLPSDYPSVAPNYTKKRSKFAKDIRLGHSRKKKAKK